VYVVVVYFVCDELVSIVKATVKIPKKKIIHTQTFVTRFQPRVPVVGSVLYFVVFFSYVFFLLLSNAQRTGVTSARGTRLFYELKACAYTANTRTSEANLRALVDI
jgi:hypothetical protein